MLQMLNVDQKKDGEDMSDEDNLVNPNGKSLQNIVEKRLILPNLTNKHANNLKDPMNLSMDFNNIDEINGNGNLNNKMEVLDTHNNKDPYRPKM
jgi:hypothetical protein